MTTHKDQLFQFNGVPVPLPGDYMIPSGTADGKGQIYWVDKLSGSDGNTGKTPKTAFATIAAAVTASNARINWSTAPWAESDTIFILPGKYAENLTSLPYGSNLIGLGDAFDLNGERGVVVQPASGYPFDGTSVINARIQNICFASPDASGCFEVENLNRTIISNCVFTGVPGASPTTVYGLRVKDETNGDGIGDMTGSWIKDCVFQVVKNGIHIETDNGSSKQASGNIIERCIIRGATLKGIYFHVDCVPSYTTIKDCIVGDGSTTLALGLDDDTGLVHVVNTSFTATANDPASADADSKYNNSYLNGVLLNNS